MGWLSDTFGGGAKRARKEKDYWQATALKYKTWAEGSAAENKARIKMAAQIKTQRDAERKKILSDSAAALQSERRRSNQRLRAQASKLNRQYTAQAKKVAKARKAESFAMRNVEKSRLKMQKFQTIKETAGLPSVSGERKEQAGSVMASRPKPLRRAVGGGRATGGGGRGNRSNSRTRPA